MTPVVVRNFAGNIEERIDFADLYSTFQFEWAMNQTYQLELTVTYSDAYETAFNALQNEAWLKYKGQWFVVKQCEPVANNGVLTKQIAAVHWSTDLTKNVRKAQQTNADANNATPVYSLDQALHFYLDGNDQGLNWDINGQFPSLPVSLGGNSLHDFLSSNASDYKLVCVPDNQFLHFYSVETFKKNYGKELRYLHNSNAIDVDEDTNDIVNQVHVLGAEKKMPDDYEGPTQYTLDYTYTDQDSVNRFRLHRGDDVTSDVISDRGQMDQFVASQIQSEPPTSLTQTFVGGDDFEMGEVRQLIVPEMNLNTPVMLTGITDNPYNVNADTTLEFNNVGRAMRDVNIALYQDIHRLNAKMDYINTFGTTTGHKENHFSELKTIDGGVSDVQYKPNA